MRSRNSIGHTHVPRNTIRSNADRSAYVFIKMLTLYMCSLSVFVRLSLFLCCVMRSLTEECRDRARTRMTCTATVVRVLLRTRTAPRRKKRHCGSNVWASSGARADMEQREAVKKTAERRRTKEERERFLQTQQPRCGLRTVTQVMGNGDELLGASRARATREG